MTRRGTRMLRWRTLRREGNGSQPASTVTHPGNPAQPDSTRHWCAECFGPRSRYADGQFCRKCELELFGPGGYDGFIRSQTARQAALRRSTTPAGTAGGYRVHYWDGTLFYGRRKYACGRMSQVRNSDIPSQYDPWTHNTMGGDTLSGTGHLATTDREQVTCTQCQAKMAVAPVP